MNAREILKQPTPPKLTTELIHLLTNLCFFNNSMKSADLLFVFGSNILHQAIGEKINNFLRTYSFNTVLLTGGIANYKESYYEPVSESELLLRHIAKSEFPQVNFIVENKSRNTLENVIYANELVDLSSIQNIAFFSHSYASKRSYLTLKKVCTTNSFYNFPIPIPVNLRDQEITQFDWFETEKGRALVWGEYLRFVTYGKRGDFPIEEVEGLLEQIKTLLEP